MVLKIETTYKNKNGEEIEYKSPLMRVMGKLMDKEEVHEFVILTDQIKIWEGSLYPKYNLYVTYDGENATPFNLELSPQAYKEIVQLDFKKGDKLRIEKDYFTNNKTGAEVPIIKANITNREVSKSRYNPNTDGVKPVINNQQLTPENAHIIFSVSLDNYLDVFKKSLEANPRKVGLNDFVASYFRIPANKMPIVDKLIDLYNEHFPAPIEQVKIEDVENTEKKDNKVKG